MSSLFSQHRVWRSHRDSSSALHIDASDYYRAFYVAASRAKRSILLLGWQFDSDVRLLRGEDAPPGVDPKALELLPLLDRLCRERPELEVRILAWDHSLFFALEREILQKIVFDLATPSRFHFKFDGTVALGGSHHQKVAIIDGQIAFIGSADLCQDRWDRSTHLVDDPLRTSRKGERYKPYHEVTASFVGEPVKSFVELFVGRWRYATGEELDGDALTLSPEENDVARDLPVTIAMPKATVGLSRTVPAGEGREAVHEIRDLHLRAIRKAERLVYVETQYFTSCSIRDALVARMSDPSLPKLDVVFVVPNKPEKPKEELAVGHAQARVFDELVAAAKAGGHAIGIFNVAASEPSSPVPTYVYIHSKLMIVDDRFFTMGSSNLANRSMVSDSEINASWCADEEEDENDGAALEAAIRSVRVRLLTEHVGAGDDVHVDAAVLEEPRGLVERLDRLVDEGTTRLRRHELEHLPPNAIELAVQEIACDYLDPQDGALPVPPPSSIRITAA